MARLVEKSCACYFFVQVFKETKKTSKRRKTKQASKTKKKTKTQTKNMKREKTKTKKEKKGGAETFKTIYKTNEALAYR